GLDGAGGGGRVGADGGGDARAVDPLEQLVLFVGAPRGEGARLADLPATLVSGRVLEDRRKVVRHDYGHGCHETGSNRGWPEIGATRHCCSGRHEPGLDRGWPEREAARLRYARSVRGAMSGHMASANATCAAATPAPGSHLWPRSRRVSSSADRVGST